MKALLILLFALAAGSLRAQTPEPDPWFRSKPLVRPADEMVVMRPQDAYEVRRPGYTLDGLSVEIVKAPNPFNLFNPFDPDVRAATRDNVVWAPDNVVWKPYIGRAIGWNFFSIHF